jgi:integrase
MPHFLTYNLRHAFCTRLSGIAPDAVAQRAMRHTSPETKWHYSSEWPTKCDRLSRKRTKMRMAEAEHYIFMTVDDNRKRKEKESTVNN